MSYWRFVETVCCWQLDIILTDSPYFVFFSAKSFNLRDFSIENRHEKIIVLFCFSSAFISSMLNDDTSQQTEIVQPRVNMRLNRKNYCSILYLICRQRRRSVSVRSKDDLCWKHIEVKTRVNTAATAKFLLDLQHTVYKVQKYSYENG